MRQELIQKILMCLNSNGVNCTDAIVQDLTITINEYDINTRETAVAIRDEDKNNYYMQKYLVAKTVKGCTDRTLNYYKKTMRSILDSINKSADEISTDDLRLYLAIRQKRDGISKTTAGNELRVMSSFFGYLTNEEIISKNPVAKMESIKVDKKQKKAFNDMDVEKIRDGCKTAYETCVVEMFLSTGCRVSELANIKITDIEGDRLVVHGKGNKDRYVYLNAKATLAVAKYISERKDNNPWLFPKSSVVVGSKEGFRRKDAVHWYRYKDRVTADEHIDVSCLESKVRKIGRRVGVDDVHPHRFRRTCATFALRRGMPVEQVSKMLGHESISTTQIYLDLSEEDLRTAHKKFVI